MLSPLGEETGDRLDGPHRHCRSTCLVFVKRKGRILVVEDDHLVAWSLREVLETAGYEVSSRDHGGRCARIGPSHPAGSGHSRHQVAGSTDAASCFARSLDLPIVFLTGEIDPTVKSRAAALQPVAYLTKPVHAGWLTANIERILAAQRGSAPLAGERSTRLRRTNEPPEALLWRI